MNSVGGSSIHSKPNEYCLFQTILEPRNYHLEISQAEKAHWYQTIRTFHNVASVYIETSVFYSSQYRCPPCDGIL
jgi:hypothetical protein